MDELLYTKFSIGDVVVSPQTNEIIREGKEKRLEPKLIALLVYLAQHAQQVISRQQITETIWPNVIVGEESITQAIFSLRNALGDDAKNPKYIETIPKKGYRFLADVIAIKAEEQNTKNPATPTPRKLPWLKLSMFIAIGIMCGLAFLLYKLKPHASYGIADILPVTKMSGAECCMAINGHQQMAFINIRGSATDIYVQDLNSGVHEQVTQDDWQKGPPSWLNDNTLIYPRCLSGECQIVQQHLQQSPQIIYSTNNYIGELVLIPNNPNAFIFNEESRDGSEFTSFDLRTGQREKWRERYANLPQAIYHPQFSQDGKQLYFVNHTSLPELMVLDLATQKIQLINNQFDEINSFSVNTKQQLLVAGMQKNTIGIWLLDKTEATPTLLVRSSSNERLLFPLTSPDSKAVYYQNAHINRDIGMLSINDGEITDTTLELNSTGIDSEAVLSNDEQFIYFVSDRTGFAEVWRYDINKKQTIPITQLKASHIKNLLPSHDGQRFSAIYMNDTQAMLGVFSIHTGELLVSLQSPAYPLSWSNNDEYLYAEDNSKGIPTLVGYDSHSLQKTDIQENAGLFAQDSKDGSSILFIDADKNSLVEHHKDTENNKVLMTLDVNAKDMFPSQFRLDSTSTSLLLIKKRQDTHQLWQYPFNAPHMEPSKLIDLPKQEQITFINSKGSKILFEKEMPVTGDIMKLELQ